jgi:SAM-dependent methyltransferase
MKNDPLSVDADYRSSHLQRGRSYDGTLAANAFDAYMADLERIHLEEIVPRLFAHGVPRYLDFACGTARITQTVAPLAREAIGVDISESMLEQARRKCPNVGFVQADLTRSELDIGQFDLATSFRFFGNAESALRAKVMQKLSQLVKPGGYLIINNHRNPNSLASLLHRASGGKKETDLSHGRIRRLLSEHGFSLVEARPIGVWLYRSRMLSRVGAPDRKALRRERVFGHRILASIAPDTILVARRVA